MTIERFLETYYNFKLQLKESKIKLLRLKKI